MSVDALIVTRNLNEVLHQTVKSLKCYPFKSIIVVSGEKADLESPKRWFDIIVYGGKEPLGRLRNIGLDLVNSEFVCMVDSDIVLTKGYVETLLKFFEDPKVAAACGRLFPLHPANLYSNIKSRINEAFNIIHGQVGCGASLYRSNIIKKVRFDPKLYTREDHNLNNRLRKLGFKVIFVKDAYCFHDFRMSMKLEIKHHAKRGNIYALLCSCSSLYHGRPYITSRDSIPAGSLRKFCLDFCNSFENSLF
ncbi:MAG: glycosyltransferase family 2 protein [Candidatus Bathyarchaeia archaeon]